MDRKQFFQQSAFFTAGLLIPSNKIFTQQDRPDPIKKEFVKEFVGASHGKFDRVKEMLEDYPNLIYSVWDWGDGDFEMCIGAAGHVGNKEIANYLLEKGARINLFVLTMLGKTDLVKPILETYPQFLNVAGPHGFTLLHHAKRGGEDAKEIYTYLEEKGLKEMKVKLG
jgi:hypothetical protein